MQVEYTKTTKETVSVIQHNRNTLRNTFEAIIEASRNGADLTSYRDELAKWEDDIIFGEAHEKMLVGVSEHLDDAEKKVVEGLRNMLNIAEIIGKLG